MIIVMLAMLPIMANQEKKKHQWQQSMMFQELGQTVMWVSNLEV